MRVRYRQLDDNDEAADVRRGWKQLLVTGETTSTVVDNLATDRQYTVLVDATNEVGYNTSLPVERIIIPDADTGMRLAGHNQLDSTTIRLYAIYE